jgi:uncharacterized membrane protein YjgN (DUF898 family)
MTKKFILSFLLILVGTFLVFTFSSQATNTFNDINGFAEKTGEAGGFNTDTGYSAIIGQIIQTALSIIGVLFVGLIIYGGFLWMTAESAVNKNNLDKAKKVITWAVVGLIIIALSYAITTFVLSTAENVR